tara:strand:+ start:1079 stop:1768 length:690 start_codon:yes stop_codon:yes gene_type:complete
MIKFFKIITILYISIVTILIFFPYSLLEKLFISISNIGKNSTFEEPKKKEIISFFGIKFFSIKSLILNFFLIPIIPLLKNNSNEMFSSSNEIRNETPKEAALIVNRQLSENIKQIYTKTKNNRIEYFFTLQPTLFYTGPITKDDKKILAFREKNKFKGFYFKEYFIEFYNLVKSTLGNDKELKNRFYDFTDLFSKSENQNFIDSVHLGDLAQDIYAKKIVEIIKSKEKQ